jgi:hypothetical protein
MIIGYELNLMRNLIYLSTFWDFDSVLEGLLTIPVMK